MIESGVKAEQTEFEPSAAVLRPVASALIATGFGQDRQHLAHEAGWRRNLKMFDRHWDGRSLSTGFDRDRRCAGAVRVDYACRIHRGNAGICDRKLRVPRKVEFASVRAYAEHSH